MKQSNVLKIEKNNFQATKTALEVALTSAKNANAPMAVINQLEKMILGLQDEISIIHAKIIDAVCIEDLKTDREKIIFSLTYYEAHDLYHCDNYVFFEKEDGKFIAKFDNFGINLLSIIAL